MKTKIAMVMTFFLVGLTIGLPKILAAESFGVSDTVKQQEGISYLCSGIGESKDDPKTKAFPAKIVFATSSGALYSDVTVRIDNNSGKKVFEVFCDGAWLLVDLPAGQYKVTATDKKGQASSCPLSLSGGQKQCTLRWPD